MNRTPVFGPSRAFAALVMLIITANTSAAGYFTQAGKIHDATGQEIQLRGISHFGFNTPILQPQYLWAMGWKEQIAQMKSLGFNAIRVPFTPDTLYNTTPVNLLSYVDPGLNPEFIGKTALQALDVWMAEADRQGMYLLLDFHSVSMRTLYPTWFVSNPADFWLTYNNQAYTKENWIRDLALVAQRYAGLEHFLGVDIYNEPNGIVRWSTGDVNAANPVNFWKDAAELGAAAVLNANPNLLIFVQGINGNFDGLEKTDIPMNWGEDFQPQAYQPLNIRSDKLVLSPHTYGPDVYVKSSFSAPDFPANLAADWETLFGQFASNHPVVIGEWGGKYGQGTGGQQDVVWQNALVDYMIGKRMGSSFYWSYSPNSGDTGGILDDALNVRTDKLALLQRLWNSTAPGSSVPVPPAPPAPTPPPATYPLQSIMSFSPESGPVGTVVTLTGSGFTGTQEAWVGAAHNVAVRVMDDTRVQVTIPADATSGAIGIFNPLYGAFTARSFTLTTVVAAPPRIRRRRGQPAPAPAPAPTPTATMQQQYISSFSPGSGPVGTVVTLNGSGFTGTNVAWVGAAHNAVVQVVSDTQLRVTIPAGATTGAIGIFNAEFAAFAATWFTVQ